MKHHKTLWNSLVMKLLISICIILIPLIVIHLVNNHYSIEVIRNQVVQSNKNMLNLHINQIDSSLNGVGNYAYQLSENMDLAYYDSKGNIDYNDYLKAKLRLYNLISNQSHFYTTIDSIFVYSVPYQDMIYTDFGSDLTEKIKIKSEVIDKLRQDPDGLLNGQWNVWEGKEQHYLLYLIKHEDVYVGAWVNMEQLVKPFKYIDFGDTGQAFITTIDDIPITGNQFISDSGINLSLADENNAISGDTDRYIMIQETSTVAKFNIIALIPEHAVLMKLPLIQRISSIITFGTVLFLLIFVLLMRKIFLTPIQQIVRAMIKLRKGDLKVRLPQKGGSREFGIMNESFNRMITQIEHLKIDIYEEKINLQQAELKHLQLQINPHFFLNSLNIIYSLATVKEFKLIQEMSKSLAEYFRFMFKSNSYFVYLEDEIAHTKNYVNIQQLRYPNGFHFYLDAEEKLLRYQIPPLIIQSLVENSIKHAFEVGNPIDVSVKIWSEQEDGNLMHIVVEDSGDGFPEEVLQKLQRNEELITEDGKRIGIWNIKRRIELLYGEGHSSMELANSDNGGAIVHLQIPIK